MKSLFVMMILAISQMAMSETFYSSIHSYSKGQIHDPFLVRFENGRASFLDKTKINVLYDEDQFLKILVDKNNYIINMYPVEHRAGRSTEGLKGINEFQPTIVQNKKAATKLFRTMRRDYTKSGECFNRAHIWTVEANKKSDVNLSKIFMFFTESYIRKYKFHWWFHVTPMVYLKNYKSPRTLDRRYTSGPLQTKTWSDIFVKSKRTCKIVDKFDDFFLNQKKEHCYHIYTSMYYYVPRDIEERDLSGIEKEIFVEKEIKKAYKNAFKSKPRD